jgi:predicted porin
LLYGDNNGASTQKSVQHLSSITGTAGLNRQFTPALSFSLQYTYFHQDQKHIPGAIAPTWNDNNFIAMLQYTWGHSLGR